MKLPSHRVYASEEISIKRLNRQRPGFSSTRQFLSEYPEQKKLLRSFAPSSHLQSERALQGLLDIQTHFKNSYDQLRRISLAINNDLNTQRSFFNRKSHKVVIDAMRVAISMLPASRATLEGEEREAMDWIERGLSYDVDLTTQRAEGHYFMPLAQMNKNAQTFEDGAAGLLWKLIHIWSDTFFYIARENKTFEEIANDLLLPCFTQAMWARHVYEDELPIVAVSQIVNWAASINHPNATNLVKSLEGMVLPKCQTPEQSLHCLSTLISYGSLYSSKSEREWAQIALNYRGNMREHQALQFLSSSIEGEDDWSAVKVDVLNEISSVSSTIKNLVVGQPIRKELCLDSRTNLITPLMGKLLHFEDFDGLIEILSRWYDVKNVSRDALWIGPGGTEEGASWIWPTGSHHNQSKKGNKSLTDLAKATSEFIQKPISGPEGTKNLSEAERWGFVNEDAGSQFEEACDDHYGFEALPWDEIRSSKPKFAIFFPAIQNPVQAFMCQKAGWALPLNVSLSVPKNDRVLTKVAIWVGPLLSIDDELNSLVKAFGDANINVILYQGDDAQTPEQFAEFYENPELDALWVISHGEFFDEYDEMPVIHISDTAQLNMDALTALQMPNSGRRLLILNVCEGATVALRNGLPRYGIASALAGTGQAVISHLWPVAPKAAAAAGSILGKHLSKGDDFFTAYENTLMALNGDNHQIADQLVDVNIHFADSVRTSSFQFANVAHWGSLAFYE